MPKNMNYAILEAIQGEMRRDKLLTLLYEYQSPSAGWSGRSINLRGGVRPAAGAVLRDRRAVDRGRRAGNVDDRRAGHRPHPQHDHVHSLTS